MSTEGAEETFEASTERLAKIVEELEQGDLPLERALALFEEGVRLARRAQERIDQAEKRIEQTHVKIRMVDVRMDKLLDRYEMKERLKFSGSALVEVNPRDIEVIEPAVPEQEVAAIRD